MYIRIFYVYKTDIQLLIWLSISAFLYLPISSFTFQQEL